MDRCKFGVLGVLLLVAPVLVPCCEARAGFLIGSSFQVQGLNSPGTFQEQVTLAPGTTLIAGGRLSVTQSIVEQGGSEWLRLQFRSTQGPLVPNINSSWELSVSGVQLEYPAFYTARMLYWTINGEPAGPIYPFRVFSPVLPNPLDPVGRNAYIQYFNNPSIQSSLGQIPSTQPFRLLSEGGMNPNLVDGVVMAFRVTPVVPEPGSFVMLSLGALAISGVASRRFRARRAMDL